MIMTMITTDETSPPERLSISTPDYTMQHTRSQYLHAIRHKNVKHYLFICSASSSRGSANSYLAIEYKRLTRDGTYLLQQCGKQKATAIRFQRRAFYHF
jgi:hypothetical protein